LRLVQQRILFISYRGWLRNLKRKYSCRLYWEKWSFAIAQWGQQV